MDSANSADGLPLPEHFSPAQVAQHFGVSERRVRSDARRHGCCRIVGNRIFLTREDLDALLEIWRATPAPSVKPNTPRLPVGSYDDLVKLRGVTSEDALRHLEKAMDRGRKAKR
ncbi:hypothetical protein [uncultured Devosia sp.]|uniref:hypothetical protein n=1 Tax=uncultured Devosia sp. TaxID=211434 RepID=UPI0035CA957D